MIPDYFSPNYDNYSMFRDVQEFFFYVPGFIDGPKTITNGIYLVRLVKLWSEGDGFLLSYFERSEVQNFS